MSALGTPRAAAHPPPPKPSPDTSLQAPAKVHHRASVQGGLLVRERVHPPGCIWGWRESDGGRRRGGGDLGHPPGGGVLAPPHPRLEVVLVAEASSSHRAASLGARVLVGTGDKTPPPL